jgi:hypothetical protein
MLKGKNVSENKTLSRYMTLRGNWREIKKTA